MATLHISNGGYGRSLYGSWDAKAANREGRKPLTASAAPRMFLVFDKTVRREDHSLMGLQSANFSLNLDWVANLDDAH